MQILKEHYDSITIHCFNFRVIYHEINPVEFTMMTITSGQHGNGTWHVKGHGRIITTTITTTTTLFLVLVRYSLVISYSWFMVEVC